MKRGFPIWETWRLLGTPPDDSPERTHRRVIQRDAQGFVLSLLCQSRGVTHTGEDSSVLDNAFALTEGHQSQQSSRMLSLGVNLAPEDPHHTDDPGTHQREASGLRGIQDLGVIKRQVFNQQAGTSAS